MSPRKYTRRWPRVAPQRRGPRRRNYFTALHSAVIKERLHAAGMTSWELADLLGVHEHEIDLEELPDQPVALVYELARRLDIHPADIIGGADDLFARRRTRRADNPPGEHDPDDVLTIATALAHADRPMTVDELCEVLAWDLERVVDALQVLRQHSAPASPLILRRVPPEHYTMTARLDVLSTSQMRHLVGNHHDMYGDTTRMRNQREPLTVTEATILRTLVVGGPVDALRDDLLDHEAAALAALVESGLVHHDETVGAYRVESDVLFSLGFLFEPPPLPETSTDTSWHSY